MMKAAAFTIALLLGGTAIAQTSTDVDTTAPATDVATTAETNATDTSAVATTDGQWSNGTTTTMATNMAPASGQVVQPGNASPERDARGIKVISAAAVVPAGYNGTTGAAGTGGPLLDANGQPIAAAGNLPPCTRTVTDRCVQTYERGRR